MYGMVAWILRLVLFAKYGELLDRFAALGDGME